MSNLINRRESKKYPGLFVKKYAKKVFFDNLWNTSADLLEARGHVEDASGKIVIRPFTKIFNRGENGTDIPRDDMVLAIRKVNGFMAAATFVPAVNEVVVSTTGSLDSDFVGYAEKFIDEKVKNVIRSMYAESGVALTFMFEICHEEDPHIIVEQFGAYLLGARVVSDDAQYFSTAAHEARLDEIAVKMGVFRPAWMICDFGSVVTLAKKCDHEGYVVYSQESDTALKIKSPYYLVLKLCARKKDIENLNKSKVDEEYYDLIDYVKGLGDSFTNLDEEARLNVMISFINSKG